MFNSETVKNRSHTRCLDERLSKVTVTGCHSSEKKRGATFGEGRASRCVLVSEAAARWHEKVSAEFE